MSAETVSVGLWVRLPSQAGREAELDALLRGAALGEHASTLLAGPPVIEGIDVLAAKLPSGS